MRKFITSYVSIGIICLANYAQALPLTPPDEPKADSFYICYEKRCPNNIIDSYVRYTRYKYVGCIISKVPCHLYCGDKFASGPPTPMKQFQWVNNYPDALNSFYRCAYN